MTLPTPLPTAWSHLPNSAQIVQERCPHHAEMLDKDLCSRLAEKPPQPPTAWVGLTVAEIFDADPCPPVMFDEERIDFAKAIETKLRS